MIKRPKLAIVGRPNVGKSALFNSICKKRISIVDEAEGITRDRIYASADLFGFHFEAIDSGGIDPRSSAPFNEEVKRQAEIAIEEADSIIMVVDGQVGVTDLDEEIARLLLKTEKPLCLAVNKIDHPSLQAAGSAFYKLGIEPVVEISAAHGFRIAELLEEAWAHAEKPLEEPQEEPRIRVVLAGRPNTGKSTLVNQLLKEERCVVSELAGTTRDSIDVLLDSGTSRLTLIDTAGIRRKNSEREAVDKFAAIRTQNSLEGSDLCLLMLDATEGFSSQDKKLLKAIEQAGKSCIILVNKWDLVKQVRMEHYLRDLKRENSFLNWCPIHFISAKTGRNLERIFPSIEQAIAERRQRIPTAELNKFLERAIQLVHPPMIQGRRLRIYYIAQVDIEPPRFALFVNYPELMTKSFERYLYNQFRKQWSFLGSPLVFHLRPKRKER